MNLCEKGKNELIQFNQTGEMQLDCFSAGPAEGKTKPGDTHM